MQNRVRYYYGYLFYYLPMWYIFIQQIIMNNPIGTKSARDLFVIILWFFIGIILPKNNFSMKQSLSNTNDTLFTYSIKERLSILLPKRPFLYS